MQLWGYLEGRQGKLWTTDLNADLFQQLNSIVCIITHIKNHQFPSPPSKVDYLTHEIIFLHGFDELSKRHEQHIGHNKIFQYLTDIQHLLDDNYHLDMRKCV